MKADDAYALGDFPTLPQQRVLVGPAVEEAVAALPRAPRIR